MNHTPQSTGYRVGNDASQADRVMLTGETSAAGQRAACDRLGIPYHRRGGGQTGRPVVDECRIYVDSAMYERIRQEERRSRCAQWLAGCEEIRAA